MTRFPTAALLLLALAPWNAASALDLRVGTGTGCTHADLGAALVSLQAQTGTHTIRINKGVYAVPDGMAYTPSVNQTGIYLEGGYSDCLAAGPSGDPTQDAHRAVFNGAGGFAGPVLILQLYGRVGTFQIRRIALTGGDATTDTPGTDYYESGGGMIVRGQASVLIGLGTSIRNNAAINGGGVALAGSNLTDIPSSRVDLFIDDGAEIRNNVATDRGGGIYCGGQNPAPAFTNSGDHHGSIVLRDGVIGYNQANSGAAFYCRGTLEGGGGFQPRPFAGRVAWIIGNQGGSGGLGCSAGYGSLDAGLPVEGDGFRHLGAALGSNGLVAVTANSGASSSALCLLGSRSRATINDPAPAGQSRFRLRNLYVSDQSGTGFIGLRTGDRMELIVEPSGDNVSCSFFGATPCVRFYNNAVDSVGTPDARLLYASGDSMLQLRRAMIDSNSLRPDLAMADDGADLILISSILDLNTVAARNVLPSTSSLFAARDNGTVDVRNSTVITRSALSEFFRLGWEPLGYNTGIAYAQASAFASTVGTPATVGYEASVPTTNFRRYWCGFFQSTADFGLHTVVNDPTTGTFEVLAPAAFSIDANYAPLTTGLRDACTAPAINRDFYGRPYTANLEPASAVHADIGAVEAQLVDAIFSNGFET
ncbi:MAG: hypothetical protein HYV17_11625 [Xanthomonadales bacterium]|nr:hypothetical protein [Xanthomonadales bacterium]